MKGALASHRAKLAWAALGFAVLSPATIALAVAGARYWGWSPGLALEGLTFGAAFYFAVAGAVFAVLAAALILAPPRGDWRKALAALVISGVAATWLGLAAAARRDAPPVHDVATDWRDPLMFSPALMTARGEGAVPVELDPFVEARTGRQRVAEINARTCRAALATIVPENSAQAYARAKQALARSGMAPVTDDLVSGRLEATAQSRWFRFTDDLVVRVRPEGAGSRIDIRSVSRSGGSDGGSNCKRVTRLRELMAQN